MTYSHLYNKHVSNDLFPLIQYAKYIDHKLGTLVNHIKLTIRKSKPSRLPNNMIERLQQFIGNAIKNVATQWTHINGKAIVYKPKREH